MIALLMDMERYNKYLKLVFLLKSSLAKQIAFTKQMTIYLLVNSPSAV